VFAIARCQNSWMLGKAINTQAKSFPWYGFLTGWTQSSKL